MRIFNWKNTRFSIFSIVIVYRERYFYGWSNASVLIFARATFRIGAKLFVVEFEQRSGARIPFCTFNEFRTSRVVALARIIFENDN